MGTEAVRIIGIHGPSGCGKTTLAKLLEVQHDYKRVSFAHPIRTAAIYIYGCPAAHFHYPWIEQLCPQWGRTHREMLQKLGTEGVRSIHPAVWALKLVNAIKQAPQEMRFVVDDVRFPNEADFLQGMGGRILELYPRTPNTQPTGHESEIPLSTRRPHAIDKCFTMVGSMLTPPELLQCASELKEEGWLP